ncbi:glycosyltransferase family 2 protein [Polaribacter haliotis]|uniref:Glycosyltransferase family 2 protein n=1 Tax=Polaribacter haliotis TaxID=1888915 RepID=A0A7L8AHN5_9FLAO|nr:glycosyltransferase family 2 protein [Polaribacter haliotis]QOD61525.1 glycosyltransferase family 2 protein [Polaribacter haliotis]
MLAIVIPYYKLTFFEQTIKSLANQTNKQFKVYIGDDASLENPQTLLAEYKYKLNYSYKRFDENLGGISLVKQWNRCIELIGDEEWIMILGDDDYLESNVVECWYNSFKEFKDKTNVIRFSTKDVLEQSNLIENKSCQPIWENSIDSFFRRIKGLTGSSLSEHIFSRKSYEKFKFIDYPLAWHSDDQAWLDFSDGKPIFSINNASCYIRISNLSISGKNDNLDLKKEATLMFQKNFISEKFYLLNKSQKLEFLLIHETLLRSKSEIRNNNWNFIFKLYFKNFKLIPFLKLLRRFIKNRFRLHILK